MNFIGQTVCAFLISISALFIVIELSAKFDKRFIVFGTTNLLLGLFCAIDIWFQPDHQILYWVRTQHILASFFPAMLLWHVMLIVKKVNMNIVKLLFLIGSLFFFLFLTKFMLHVSDNEIISSTLYNVTFAPFLFLSIISTFLFMTLNIKNVNAPERSMLYYHLFGALLLALGGILDLIAILKGFRILGQASFSMIGLMGFIFVTSITFIDRLSMLLREREATFEKLRQAYHELEEVQSLKEIGQSTTIINHEIRNYMTSIHGFADVLYNIAEITNEKRKKYAGLILEAAIKLTTFSNDILELSKSRITRDKQPLNISQLIRKTVEFHFKTKAEKISIVELDGKEVIMNGDWGRLEHVFVNIFKNAFEAGAELIIVRISHTHTVVICSIEDDGVGCTAEQFPNLFKSFYTTKKNSGGTGLGMSLVRSIVESHGGAISAYTKNILENDIHGLVLNISFPLFETDIANVSEQKSNIILVKEDIKDLTGVFRVFKNVLLNPRVVQKVDEIDSKFKIDSSVAVLGTVGSLNKFKTRFPNSRCNRFALVAGSQNIMFIVEEKPGATPSILSEEYLMSTIFQNNKGK